MSDRQHQKGYDPVIIGKNVDYLPIFDVYFGIVAFVSDIGQIL